MIYVILSSFLYVVAYLYPSMFTWCLFLFCMPLGRSNNITFKSGVVWGAISFSMLWWWLLLLFIKYNVGILGIIYWVLVVGWCCLASGLWFIFFPRFPVISTVLFCEAISYYWLFPSGQLLGMPLLYPLVPLASYPWLLSGLAVMPSWLLLAMIIGIQVWCRRWYNFAVVVSIFLIVSYVVGPYKPIKPFVIIKPLCPWWYKCGDPMYAGYRLSEEISSVVHNKVKPDLICLPESTFCWDLHEYKNFIPIWCDSAQDVGILLGSYYFRDGFAHNCLFFLHNNEQKFFYLKQHAMPMVEQVTWLERLWGVSLLGIPVRNQGSCTCDSDRIQIKDVWYQIWVCSELFFESKKCSGDPILFLWNESWLMCDGMKQLALLYIVYFEQKHRTLVWHVSTQGRTNL